MISIILGERPVAYDADKHLLFSPACVFNDQDGLFAGNYRFAQYDFSRQDYTEVSRQVIECYRPLLEKFSQLLNQKNNLQERVIFWEVVIGDWLLFSLGKIFEAQKRLEAFQRQYLEGKYHVPLIDLEHTEPSCFARQADYNAAAQRCLIFNHYLYSIAYGLSSFPNWTCDVTRVPYWQASPMATKKVMPWRQRLFHALKSPLRIQAIFGFNPIHFLLLQVALCFNRLFNRKCLKLPTHGAIIRPDSSALDSLYQKLLKILPVEYFDIREKYQTAVRYSSGFFFADNIKSPALEDIKLAKMRSLGVSIYLCQHGGSYGDVHMTVKNDLFDMSRFGFVSWGLSNRATRSEHLVFLPSPMLSRFAGRPMNGPKKDVAVVSTVLTPFNLSSTSSYDPNFVKDYVDRISTLLKRMTLPEGETLYFRPRMTHREHAFDIYGQVHARCPEVPILKGDLDRLLPGLQLLILTDPGSVLHKCLAANIPFLICWNRKAWIMDSDYERHLDRLEQLGIFHDSPDTLTNVFKQINGQIQTWWHDADRQSALELFRRDFAPVSRHCFIQWFKSLCQIPKIIVE